MPHYRSRSKSRERKEQKRVRKKIPRDKRKLIRWAAKGTKKDYEKLRKHANKILLGGKLPGYIHPLAMEDLGNATRATLIGALHHPDSHLGGGLTDGLAHALDWVPGHQWSWANHLMQAALRPFRGDGMTEQDETYARVVGAGYNYIHERPDTVEGYTRQKDYDGKYVSVWDNDADSRLIVVRGTKPTHWEDWKQNARIMMKGGRPQDLVGRELADIMNNSQGKTVDVMSHSLGTSLTLEAYKSNPGMQDKIRETFLYNPAYTVGGFGSTRDFESDKRVRYFLNTGDIVSIGSLGSSGPVNMVIRNPKSLNPLDAHEMAQWFGGGTVPERLKESLEKPPDPDREPATIGVDVDPRFKGETQTFKAYNKP